MQTNTLSAGDAIEARCTKCRKNTKHMIIAMANEGPVKVKCDICDRQHDYRPPTLAKSPARKGAAKSKDADQREWETLRPGMNPAEAKNYSMNATYKVNSLINHPVFGLGLVMRVSGPQKIEVLFENGKKTMRCK